MVEYKSTTRETQEILTDRYLDDYIGIHLLEENAKEQEGKKPSGKLSAGKLGWPLQHQILNRLGIAGAPPDEYGIRKMVRGKEIEDWFLARCPKVVKKQQFREYRGVIGYEDSSMDTLDWNNPCGIIPVEVKSVANAKFKRIVQQGPDTSHILQNCLYALATDTPKFAIAYVAADDLRVKVYIMNTADFRTKVDAIIDRYEKQGVVVPVFEPEEKWQANPKYNSFQEWADLDEAGIKAKLTQLQADGALRIPAGN